jgi:hypothetical protein
MKARTLIQLCGKDAEAFVHQGRQKFNYLFFVFGFVCCFASYCGMALMSWFR